MAHPTEEFIESTTERRGRVLAAKRAKRRIKLAERKTAV
jgi:hypothetical protein